jgi:hypothetical protein
MYIYSYRKPALTKNRVEFDPSNKDHMAAFGCFVKNGGWKDGCPFYLEEPYTDIPTMICNKIAVHATELCQK